MGTTSKRPKKRVLKGTVLPKKTKLADVRAQARADAALTPTPEAK